MVRGSTGIFYDTLESSMINRESNTGPVGQTTIDLRQGDPLFPTFPNRLSRVSERRGRRCRARLVYVPIFQGPDFPLGIGDQFHRIAPHFFNTNVGVQHELSTNWALSADYTRVYGYDLLTTLDINAPPYFALGPGQTRTQAQADRAAAARRAEHDGRAVRHRVHRVPQAVSPGQRRAARSTTPSSSR